MTAVAQPLTSFQPSTRLGWSSNGTGLMNPDEVSRMFAPQRKTAQRQNSSSSLSSNASTGSTTTVLAAPITNGSQPQTNGAVQPVGAEAGNWATRKKPTRGLWPPGKAEAATGISTARPQTVSAATSAGTATSAISALHAPLLPSQQMTNGPAQVNGVLREQQQAMPPAILHLIPMNGTFERKTITVPYAPDVLRIGRQTNQKTVPTPLNGYFDSKVLSRQHAEIYADRQGRIFIRDVKSSNGTFVNGMRLSQENKESEPRELREQDVLELGIDIVSEDQKTVVHHKVAAKVEYAGIYGQGNDVLSFGDLDPSAGQGLMSSPHQLKRTGSTGSINARSAVNPAVSQAAMNMGVMSQPQHMRNWLNPITTEHIVRKLNHEMKLAQQQSQEIARARQAIEHMLGGKIEPPALLPEKKAGSEKSRPSPTKSKLDLKAHFSEPPAPPPQAPLPEKPDVARALADPIIQPLLRRSDTARAPSGNASPTRVDHSSDILRLCEELKLAKGELSSQSERMKTLEHELAQERSARESAEERAQSLEQSGRRDSPTNEDLESPGSSPTSCNTSTFGDSGYGSGESAPDLQAQLDRLRSSMDEMKQTMESYRRRAETAEAERDEARKTLSDMVEQKRRENSESSETVRSPSKPRRSPGKRPNHFDGSAPDLNGHAVKPAPATSPTSVSLLKRAGVEEGKPITKEQAEIITQYLAQELLGPQPSSRTGQKNDALLYYGLPYGSFAAVVVLGYVAMTYINGWPKLER